MPSFAHNLCKENYSQETCTAFCAVMARINNEAMYVYYKNSNDFYKEVEEEYDGSCDLDNLEYKEEVGIDTYMLDHPEYQEEDDEIFDESWFE